MRSAIWAACAAATLLSACGGEEPLGGEVEFATPETAIDYEIELVGAPSEEAEALMRESLDVFRKQEDGAQSVAFLRRRALNDVETVQTILRSFGYYEGDATVAVIPGEAAPDAAPEAEARDGDDVSEDDASRPTALARIMVEPGPLFTLAAHRFEVVTGGERPAPPLDASDLGSPVGEGAEARPILAAETAAVAKLRAAGRPYAEIEGRDAVADLEANTLEVVTTVSAGPFATYGDVEIEGLTQVQSDYVRTYIPLEEGAPVALSELREIQRDLADTNLFDTVSVRPPEAAPAADGPVPITVSADEAPHRTIDAGLRWSTDIGPAARARFEHRNLGNRNETLSLEATASFEEQRFTTRYRVPQWRRPGQDFLAGGEIRNVENDAFDEQAFTLTAGVERALSDEVTVGAGGLLDLSQTTENGETTIYQLAGLPAFIDMDRSNDLLNPTEGWRARLDVTPFMGFADDGSIPLFSKLQTRVSGYLPLDSERRYVLAGRLRLGSIITDEVDTVPPARRFYSGGGGSVRGYAERAIGPEDEDGDPSGGLSVLELGTEIRARLFGPVGLAAFVEAGSVSEEVAPVFDEGVQVAAGLGARYYSPVGPIRVDVGVPVNPQDDDEAFQLYLSIGQAY